MSTWKLSIFAVGTALATTVPAAAQDLTFDASHTASCLALATTQDDKRACIGSAADACMEDSDGGYSTVGMGGCLSMELDWWDARLNLAYSKLMKREKADDAEYADQSDYIPSKSKALRAMQRAWIPFRDARCDYERSQWGGGTGGGPATVSCLLQMTAEQTLYLQASQAEIQ